MADEEFRKRYSGKPIATVKEKLAVS
jgi:hypothetical protein